MILDWKNLMSRCETKETPPTKTEKKNVISLYVTNDSSPSGDCTGR